MARKAAEFA
jgi:hypothetical protein